MTVRALSALALAVCASACAAIPSLTFVPDDASSSEESATPLDGAVTPSPDATADDASMSDVTDAYVDAQAADAPSSPPDSGPTCPPSGAPAGTQCCPGGTPCIGPACSRCSACSCAVGLYCCATENGGGHVQGTNCSNAPTGPTCPTH